MTAATSPPRGITLAPTSSTGISDQAARLRAEVALASVIVAPHWPIESFIAVNPLGGLEDVPFAAALARAGDVFGARGTLTDTEFRDCHAAGRVTDADLDTVLLERVPQAVTRASLRFGATSVTMLELLRLDLLHGEPAPPPVRSVVTRAEERSVQLASAVDANVAKWCAGYFGAPGATWVMPGRAAGLYSAWRALAPHDRDFPTMARRSLRALPVQPDEAAITALGALGVSESDWREYCVAHLTRLPGWAGHVRWRASRAGVHDELFEFLTIRLVVEAELIAAGGVFAERPMGPGAGRRVPDPSGAERARRVAAAIGAQPDRAALGAAAAVLERLPVQERSLVWLAAYERHYRDELLARLSDTPAPASPEPTQPTRRAQVPGRAAAHGRPGRPAAQVVCCIDTRSEGLRRHLESAGRFETFGFAGFFAAAIQFRDLAGGRPDDLCPALISPRNAVQEQAAPGDLDLALRSVAGRRSMDGASGALHAAERGGLAPFALAESAGWFTGPAAAAKTFSAARYGRIRERLQRAIAPQARTAVDVDTGFTREERTQLAEVALRTIGLTANFSRLVVLCGHGSTTENNPYGAALDCGACGGNRGAANARTAAAILNRDDVLDDLAATGIHVPADTWFVAAEHDTATDRVILLDHHLAPPGHHGDLTMLQAALDAAAERLATERIATLPGAPAVASRAAAARHARTRSADWAQVYPEWGLARNAAMIIGPRAMTRHLDLERRVFLHSYEHEVDEGGQALETILTAPLVVAQWINCQYYFSAVDPVVFGAGTKTIHNAIAGVGVLAGHAGDLQTGLPWQSVAEGDRLVHEPMRLLAAVQAPLHRIEAIVERNAGLHRLVEHEWITLVARPQAETPWKHLTTEGWKPWNATAQEDFSA